MTVPLFANCIICYSTFPIARALCRLRCPQVPREKGVRGVCPCCCPCPEHTRQLCLPVSSLLIPHVQVLWTEVKHAQFLFGDEGCVISQLSLHTCAFCCASLLVETKTTWLFSNFIPVNTFSPFTILHLILSFLTLSLWSLFVKNRQCNNSSSPNCLRGSKKSLELDR